MPATAFITVDEVAKFIDPNHTALSVEESALYTAVVSAVCEAMEQYLNRPVVARELTEVSDGGSTRIFLRHLDPGYLSVTSVVEDGETLTLDTDYMVYSAEGYIARVSGDAFAEFTKKPQAVTITYTAGVAQAVNGVPENLKLCAKIAARFYLKMGPEDYGRRVQEGQFISPDKFPRQCLWLMESYRAPGGAA